MDTPLQTALNKAWTCVNAAVWALLTGGSGAVVDSLHHLSTYEDPLDWVGLRKTFITGAMIGLGLWMRKEKALATPPPDTPKSDAAAMKQAAEAAVKQAEASAIVVIPVDPAKP